MSKNFAHTILDTYFNQDRPLEIKHKDGSVSTGKLISFFHGDDGEIERWHFLDESEVEKHKESISIDGSSEYGKVINQNDIESVKFKE